MPCIRVCRNDCFKVCNPPKKPDDQYNNGMENLRRFWEEWDLRILILYILFTQLYLLFFGRHRRKSTAWVLQTMNVWLLYLFSDLLATIALGKLSKIKFDDPSDCNNTTTVLKAKGVPHPDPGHSNEPSGQPSNNTIGQQLRGLWAPVILFYLGGPDTITVLRVEENRLWVRHLVGLLTQGLRTGYVLVVTWTPYGLSLLSLLMLIPGIIKYGERVWVLKSRAVETYEGFDELDEARIDELCVSWPKARPVLQAYSWFQTLMPHNSSYECERDQLISSVREFRKSVKEGAIDDTFKLIEIELGLIYDWLFSKVGTIFTVWGSTLRFISFSCIVAVLVGFLKVKRPPEYKKGDFPITIILLVGALFLEIAGVLVQLVSDWVIVWACKHPSKLVTPVLSLHDFRVSRSKRWSGFMGQFNSLDFCKKYKPTQCNRMMDCLLGKEKMLKGYSSTSSLSQHLKELIIIQLRKRSEEVGKQRSTEKVENADNLQTLTKKGSGDDNLQASTKEVAGGADSLQTSSEIDTEQISSVEKVGGADNLHTSTKKGSSNDNLQASTEEVADDITLQTSRGEWTFKKYDCLQDADSWCVNLQFDRCIVIWHVATEVCYRLDYPTIVIRDKVKLETVRMLSNYMMYLLVICTSRFPFCNRYGGKFMKDNDEVKTLFSEVEKPTSSNNPKGVKKEKEGENTINVKPGNNIQKFVGDPKKVKKEERGAKPPTNIMLANKLAEDLMGNSKRWDFMGDMWVEMLCYAASQCPIKNHVEELRHGGEFLTHVWLLLLHFGVPKMLERAGNRKDEYDSGAKTTGSAGGEMEQNAMEDEGFWK